VLPAPRFRLAEPRLKRFAITDLSVPIEIIGRHFNNNDLTGFNGVTIVPEPFRRRVCVRVMPPKRSVNSDLTASSSRRVRSVIGSKISMRYEMSIAPC
jgi:hypothetical protein